MKKYTPFIQPAIIVALILYIFLFDGCGKDKGITTTVATPEVTGSFPAVINPAPNPAPKPEYRYLAGKDKTDTITVENPVNIDLWNYYVNAEQSKKDSIHADAIGEREYTLNNEDKFLKTTSHIKTRGELLSYQLTEYTIKPQDVEIKNPFRLLAGFEIGNTIELDDVSAKGNLMLQNRKGNILSVGYDTNRRIYAGYNFVIK